MMSEVASALRVFGPMSVAEIAAYLGVSVTVVRTDLRTMRKRNEAHRCAWRPPTGRGLWCPIFKSGSGTDVAMPKPVSSSVRNKKYRARNADLLKRRKVGATASPWEGLLK